MERQRLEEITALLMGLAVLYDKEMTREAFEIYATALDDMPLPEIKEAIQRYMGNPMNQKFPLPAQLKAALKPTDEQEARDAIGRIIQALHKYRDPYQHKMERTEKAKTFIGELGWLVVERNGGWAKLSEALPEDLGTSAQAQWREMLISAMNKERLGIRDVPPSLPKAEHKPRLESLGFLPKLVKK